MNLDQLLCVCPDVISQEVAGETILLDLGRESYFGLNEVGSSLWRLLKTGTSVAELIAALRTEYDVEGARLEADITGLLGQLLEEGLVHSYDGESVATASWPARD